MALDIELIEKHDQKSILQVYYANYLTNVKGLSPSTVAHYFDALNNISRRLKEKGLITNDIYEVLDVDTLEKLKDVLLSDPDFVDLNRRGNSMYSAGLNNYIKFAKGEDFATVKEKINYLDIPVPKVPSTSAERTQWKRSSILRTQAIEYAGYECEINACHESFVAEKTKKPYMEGHHTLPMSLQDNFDVSLDIYANIVCLCPVCHRRIHYGLKCDRKEMVDRIYDNRADRLANSGIILSRQEFEAKVFSE